MSTLKEIVHRCRLMCGQEAEALQLPIEAGYIMHDSIIQDDYDQWTEEMFSTWVEIVLNVFGVENEDALLTLYGRCQELLGLYGELMQKVVDTPSKGQDETKGKKSNELN